MRFTGIMLGCSSKIAGRPSSKVLETCIGCLEGPVQELGWMARANEGLCGECDLN
jgi:hypothetical protein